MNFQLISDTRAMMTRVKYLVYDSLQIGHSYIYTRVNIRRFTVHKRIRVKLTRYVSSV